jgi:hypothetical protein
MSSATVRESDASYTHGSLSRWRVSEIIHLDEIGLKSTKKEAYPVAVATVS